MTLEQFSVATLISLEHSSLLFGFAGIVAGFLISHVILSVVD